MSRPHLGDDAGRYGDRAAECRQSANDEFDPATRHAYHRLAEAYEAVARSAALRQGGLDSPIPTDRS